MLTRALSTAAAVIALLGGAITLAGWLTGIPDLTDWDNDGIAMLANTAAAMMASGAGLLLLLLAGRRWGLLVLARICAAAAALIGGLTLLEHIAGWNLGIDTLLIHPHWGERAAAAPGRMGPPASMTFLLIGSAIFLATWRIPTTRFIASTLALVATIPPLISWAAYLYGAELLYSTPHLTGIAHQTAALLFVLAVGVALAIEDHGLGAMVRKDDVGGTLMCRLLPVSLVLLLTTGWLEDFGEKKGLYDHAFGNALLTVVRVIIFTALLWWTASVISQQVARRRRVEAALSESEDRFRVIADSIPQLAWTARPDGWIHWYNQRWYQYTGTTPQQMEGWGWQSVHDSKVLPSVMERWKTSINTGETFDMVFPLRGADGIFRPFLTRVIPVKDATGAVVQWFGTNTDISEQRAMQDALREANQMKDEFLATLSHELRTPMSAILGWVQMLRRLKSSTPQTMPQDVVRGLEVIERNARLQAQIIEDLLDMNRIISGKMRLDVQTIQMSEVVNAAVDSIRPAAEAKGVRLQMVCEPIDHDVRGDPNRLQQVFYNLLTNAVKFTPKGGRIQVTCQRVNSHVEVAVSDTGVGIKSEFLPHVFERFRQQDASITRSYGGLGLGLGIVKHLVELHGGTVHAASEGENRGTTFTVNLPVSIAILPSHAAGELANRQHPSAASWLADHDGAPADAQRLEGITVLIVDDEADARELLRQLLESHGAQAVVAGSAEEAVQMFARHRPHVLLSDIGMPGVDGLQLVRRLRQLSPDAGGRTPAIALTAFARSEDRTRSLQAGFDLHISKPVETAELLASIATVVGRKSESA